MDCHFLKHVSVMEKEELLLRRRRYLESHRQFRSPSPRRTHPHWPKALLSRTPPTDHVSDTPPDSPKKRPGASPYLDLSEEAPNCTEPPDKRDTEAKRIVITGELYQIEVCISPIGEGGQRIYFDAALDLCAGCNLLRAN
jgi:hypothetical protein